MFNTLVYIFGGCLQAATEFQPQFVITGFQTTPARLATTHDPKSGTSTLLFGGAQGGLGVVIFPKTYGQNKHFRVRITKGKPPVRIHADKLTTMGRPSEEYGGVHIRQWHGHCDWVNELAWIPTLGSFVSCSSDPKASVTPMTHINISRLIPTLVFFFFVGQLERTRMDCTYLPSISRGYRE